MSALQTAREALAVRIGGFAVPRQLALGTEAAERRAVGREEGRRALMALRDPPGGTFPTGTGFRFDGRDLTVLRFVPDNGWDGHLYAVVDGNGVEGLIREIHVEGAMMGARLDALLAGHDEAHARGDARDAAGGSTPGRPISSAPAPISPENKETETPRPGR